VLFDAFRFHDLCKGCVSWCCELSWGLRAERESPPSRQFLCFLEYWYLWGGKQTMIQSINQSILSYPIPSHRIRSDPILSYSILFYFILNLSMYQSINLVYSPRSGYGYGESAKLAASRFKKHKGCGAQICKVSAGDKRILDHLGDVCEDFYFWESTPISCCATNSWCRWLGHCFTWDKAIQVPALSMAKPSQWQISLFWPQWKLRKKTHNNLM
jgi:hypothetical protein